MRPTFLAPTQQDSIRCTNESAHSIDSHVNYYHHHVHNDGMAKLFTGCQFISTKIVFILIR